MLVPHYPDESKETYYNYYVNQVGRGVGVFEGLAIMRGDGIGDLLCGQAKSTLPLFKQGRKMLGKQLLNTGMNIVKDAIDGRNLAEWARDNFRQGGPNLLSNISLKIEGGNRRPPKRS